VNGCHVEPQHLNNSTFALEMRSRSKGPIQLGDFSEPQPDFALLVRRDDFYEHQRPMAEDVLLAIEVSDTTLRYDLETKMALYARNGVTELWILDAEAKRLHTFRSPNGTTYADVSSPERPAQMAISALPDLTIDLSRVFG
jgi:Uma2 family endonuclease